MQTLTDKEQEICKSSVALFSILNVKFKHSTMKFFYTCSIANYAEMKIKVLRSGWAV